MLKLVNVGKIYSSGTNVAVGIRKVNLELNIGEFVAITGESGSGKTTLLNVLSGIDTYEEGEMYVNGEETSYFTTEDLEDYRNRYVGFIFQNYNIIDSYTVAQNIEASLLFNNYPKDKIKERVKELVEEVGLTHRLHTKSSKLSGGEKQRVVIARALAKDPLILAADEPTGNLDSESSKQIIELLHKLSSNRLVLIVTHSFEEVSEYATRVLRVYDSEVKEDKIIKRVESSNVEEKELTDTNVKKIRLIPQSFIDLFASPKRFIFNLTVFLVMSLLVLLSVGAYRVIVTQSSYSYSAFENQDKRRIIINKFDKTPFSTDEINSIKSLNSVDFVVENDYFLDFKLSYTFNDSQYYNYIDTFIGDSSILKDSEIDYGRNVSSKYEIVIAVSLDSLKNNGFSSFEEVIGKKVSNLYGYGFIPLYDDGDSVVNYTIVGVINQSSTTNSQYMYFNHELIEEAKLSYYFNTYLTTEIHKGEAVDATTMIKYKLNDTLTKGHIIISSNVALYLELHDGDVITIKYEDSSYGTILSKEYIIDSVYEDYQYNQDINFSAEDYNEIINIVKAPRQLSVFAKNESRTESLYQTLQNNGFRAVHASQQAKQSTIDAALTIIVTIVIVEFLVGTFFLVFATMNHSVKSRSDDIEILRTIGATKKDLRFMLTLEYVFTGIVSFILSLLILLLVYVLVKPNIKIYIEYVKFLDYVIVFLLVLVMSYLLSLMFVKSIFKASVKKGLNDNKR